MSATLELLLADAFDLRPALPSGLPEDAASKAPSPEKVPRGVDTSHLEAPDADPNALALQRWAVIAPEGPAGEQALDAIAPLLALRAGEQGATPRVYRVPPGMDFALSVRWKNVVLRDEAVPEAERPRYLLIIGDLDEVSAELAHVLANGAFVGRIHFDQPEGYAAYAQKVVRWERVPAGGGTRALFFAAEDGSQATKLGRSLLIEPCHEMASKATGSPFAGGIEAPWSEVSSGSDFVERGNTARPSVLLSVCHGIGRPTSGWRTIDQQHALQGALLVGSKVDAASLATAEMLQNKPFLPGGLWFAVACFGAGTPAQSVYYPWLERLEGMRGKTAFVLESLPRPGERPFLAALPKAALANPAGPLGIISHLDLAWSSGAGRAARSRAARIFSVLQSMARGSRAGVALDALMRAYREVNDELLASYQAEEDARAWKRSFTVDGAARAHAFILRNDLRGYVLLGDPAARLPLGQNA